MTLTASQVDPDKMIKVLPVGRRVVLGGDVQAVITGISIRDNNLVWYEVVWWNDFERREALVQSLEVVPVDTEQERVEIGFIH